MTAPEFRLVPRAALKIHEEIVDADVRRLVDQMVRDGVVTDPILVARGSMVILNGHHRYEALGRLGAQRVPIWLVDYDDPAIVLERWGDGPALRKSEVVERARTGHPYPPKTTKHTVRIDLPPHPTPLADLGVRAPAR